MGQIQRRARQGLKMGVVAGILFGLATPARAEIGVASFYGAGEHLNATTANGEKFDPTKLRCASWRYPFNTVLKVTNLANGRSVRVRVTDRGPAKRLGRVIDLTPAAFGKIGKLSEGLIKVKVEVETNA